MSEIESSVVIIERSSTLKPLLKQIADEAAAKPDTPPPMVAVRIPRNERPLLMDAALRIEKRFYWSRGQHAGNNLEPVLVKTTGELVQNIDHRGLMIIDLSTIANDDDWEDLQRKIMTERKPSLILLVSEQDPGELLSSKKISNEFRTEIVRTYAWPDAMKRSASMKRDYFLHHVISKNERIGEALENSREARLLLQDVFAYPERGRSIEEVLHFANAYLNHVDNFEPTKHPVEVLAHYVTHVLDETRVSTPPSEDEDSDVNAA